MKRLVTFAFLFMAAMPASSRAWHCGPGGLQQGLARVDQGKIRLRQVLVMPECETHQRDVEMEVNGKKVVKKETYMVTRCVARIVPMVLDVDQIQASDTFGKRIEAAKLADMLKTETPVVIVANGAKPDPQYLRVFKKGTLVLMIAENAGAMPVPVAAPVPSDNGPAPAKVAPPPAEDPADKKIVLPKGLQPTPSMASIDETGTLRIRQRHDNVFMSTMNTEIEEKGKTVCVPLAIRHTTQSVETREMPSKHVRAFRADGKPVPADKLPQLLAGETSVLLSNDGNMVDPYYLQIVRESTLVLVMPRPVPAVAQPAPAPRRAPAPVGAPET